MKYNSSHRSSRFNQSSKCYNPFGSRRQNYINENDFDNEDDDFNNDFDNDEYKNTTRKKTFTPPDNDTVIQDNCDALKNLSSKLGYRWVEDNNSDLGSGHIKIGAVTINIEYDERLQSVTIDLGSDEITDLEDDTTKLSNFTVDLQTAEIVIKSVQDKLP